MSETTPEQTSEQGSMKALGGMNGVVSAIRQSTLLQQGARYVIVGLSSAAIELALFFLLHVLLDVYVVASNVAAITVATAYNFIMSRKWTFKSVSNLPRTLCLYLLLFTWNQVFSSWAIVSLMDIGFHAIIAKMLTMFAITSWNFILYRKVVFR